jgi:hypothetical protein
MYGSLRTPVILSRGANLCAPLAELRAAGMETTGGSRLEEVERDYVLCVFTRVGWQSQRYGDSSWGTPHDLAHHEK